SHLGGFKFSNSNNQNIITTIWLLSVTRARCHCEESALGIVRSIMSQSITHRHFHSSWLQTNANEWLIKAPSSRVGHLKFPYFLYLSFSTRIVDNNLT